MQDDEVIADVFDDVVFIYVCFLIVRDLGVALGLSGWCIGFLVGVICLQKQGV